MTACAQSSAASSDSSKRRLATGAVAVLVTLFGILGGVALGSNFAPKYADSSSHTYAMNSLETYTTTAALWGAAKLNGTQMSVYIDTTPDIHTDVMVYDSDYGGSWWATHYGLASCILNGSNNSCDQWNVYYDTSNLDGYSTEYLRRAGCHEFGHTVGLEHREVSGSCMRQNIADDSNYYSSHDKDHINDKY